MLKTIIFTIMMATTIYRRYKQWNAKRWNIVLGLLLAGGSYRQAVAVGEQEQHDNQGALQMVQHKDKKDLLSQKQKDVLQEVGKDVLQKAEELKKQVERMHGVGDIPRNIVDLILNLSEIENYNYRPAALSGRDYFDIMCDIYYDTVRYSRNVLSNASRESLLNDFRVKLKYALNVPVKLAKLRSMGLTDLDIAILNEDVAYVEAEVEKEKQRTPLQLVKKYRMIEIAENYTILPEHAPILEWEYCSEEERPLMGISAELRDFSRCLNEQVARLRSPLPNGGRNNLGALLHCLSSDIYKDIPPGAKTMFVSISGKGQPGNRIIVWDNPTLQYNYERIIPHFDASMLMGDGRKVLTSKDADRMVKALNEVAKLGLDFILVLIEMHDSVADAVLKEMISKLPGSVAKETLYVIDGCHSTQYHEDWLHQHKEAALITTAGYTTTDPEKLGKKALAAFLYEDKDYTTVIKPHELYALLKSDGLAKPNLKKFIAYYAKAVTRSNPWISGKLAGRFEAKMRLRDYANRL